MFEKTLYEYKEIKGLKWVRNVNIATGPHSSILLGGRVSTGVLRQPGFYTEYSIWGIHIATDDELTFVQKGDEKPVIVKLVDCRKGSPTLHNYLEVECTPDPGRRLVIPRGVAHLPTQVDGLITINTPTLYWDYARRFVSLEIDVINVERDRDLKKFPVYAVCRFLMPSWAYSAALQIFKERYNPAYEAPFVFDRGGKMAILRKKVQSLKYHDDSQTQLQGITHRTEVTIV